MMIQYMVKSLNLQSSKPSNPAGTRRRRRGGPLGQRLCLWFQFKHEHNVMLLSCLHTKTISTLKQNPWFTSNPHLWDTWAWPPCFTQIPPLPFDSPIGFFFTQRTFPLVFSGPSLPPYKYSFLPCLMHSKLKKVS